MEDQILKYFYDIQEAASAIRRFVHGRTFDDYQGDELLRSGVERKFEIIGEALNRIGRENPDILGEIREYRSIISFRNLLAHGYNSIDDRIVWGIIEEELGLLTDDIQYLIESDSSEQTEIEENRDTEA
ncbi:MAG: DUF86 domain-containing protein [Gemmatimonadetes bacterium]|jgi:uncharacterized protein with HEPN domain|nr:DUF86 domain-containing protein [Gemmatimonadota bacterium]